MTTYSHQFMCFGRLYRKEKWTFTKSMLLPIDKTFLSRIIYHCIIPTAGEQYLSKSKMAVIA